MPRDTFRKIIVIVSLVFIIGVPLLSAQQQKKFTDFRGRNYSADELGAALFPQQEEEARTRGIAPIAKQPQQPVAPVKVSVALNVLFEFNSDQIMPQYYSDLDKLGQVLTDPKYAEYRLQIEGHTDSIGSAYYNQALSERRAASIKKYLVDRFSIDTERLVVKGYGKDQPIASNNTDEGRAKNRRVEVVNLGK
jgi:outer membrane protein OmpA-like peptidoglycan-associated protein